MGKGFERSVMQKEFKVRRVQDHRSQQVTDTEAIRNQQEDRRIDVWWKYLNKMNNQVKKQKQAARD